MRPKLDQPQEGHPEIESACDDFGFATRAISQRNGNSGASDDSWQDEFIDSCDIKLSGSRENKALTVSAADDRDRCSTLILERKLAYLEGAEAGLVLASGLAAFSTLARSLLSEGDEMIVQKSVCTETTALMEKVLSAAGAKMVAVDLSDLANIDRSMNGRTRLVYFETPANPLAAILDISAIAGRSHALGLKVAVDSTFASPALQRPIEHGAHIVLQSLTKYINGHGDTVGGALFADSETILKMREASVRDPVKTAISPHASFLILRGLKTLALRMDRHSSAAHAIALTLEAHPAVSWVSYPFLQSHPNYAIARKQMSGGAGMVAFGLHAGRQGARTMIKRLRLITSASSFGDVGSLICHSTNHSSARHLSLQGSELCNALGEDVVRCSVGLEDAEDLIEDIWQALEPL